MTSVLASYPAHNRYKQLQGKLGRSSVIMFTAYASETSSMSIQ